MKILISCSCSGVPNKAEKAFQLLFPDDDLPIAYRGKDSARKLAEQKPNTNLANHLSAIAKKSGRWAYYIAYDMDGNITEMYDLLTTKRIA